MDEPEPGFDSRKEVEIMQDKATRALRHSKLDILNHPTNISSNTVFQQIKVTNEAVISEFKTIYDIYINEKTEDINMLLNSLQTLFIYAYLENINVFPEFLLYKIPLVFNSMLSTPNIDIKLGVLRFFYAISDYENSNLLEPMILNGFLNCFCEYTSPLLPDTYYIDLILACLLNVTSSFPKELLKAEYFVLFNNILFKLQTTLFNKKLVLDILLSLSKSIYGIHYFQFFIEIIEKILFDQSFNKCWVNCVHILYEFSKREVLIANVSANQKIIQFLNQILYNKNIKSIVLSLNILNKIISVQNTSCVNDLERLLVLCNTSNEKVSKAAMKVYEHIANLDHNVINISFLKKILQEGFIKCRAISVQIIYNAFENGDDAIKREVLENEIFVDLSNILLIYSFSCIDIVESLMIDIFNYATLINSQLIFEQYNKCSIDDIYEYIKENDELGKRLDVLFNMFQENINIKQIEF